MKFADIKNRSLVVEHGGWVKGLPDLEGVAIKVRGTSSSLYRRRLGEEFAKLSVEERQDDKKLGDILNALQRECLILDWAGIEDLPFTEENVVMVQTDPAAKLLLEGIEIAIRNVSSNGKLTLEEDVKN